MVAGIAAVAHSFNPDCRVTGVQPEASPAALLSLRDGVATVVCVLSGGNLATAVLRDILVAFTSQ